MASIDDFSLGTIGHGSKVTLTEIKLVQGKSDDDPYAIHVINELTITLHQQDSSAASNDLLTKSESAFMCCVMTFFMLVFTAIAICAVVITVLHFANNDKAKVFDQDQELVRRLINETIRYRFGGYNNI